MGCWENIYTPRVWMYADRIAVESSATVKVWRWRQKAQEGRAGKIEGERDICCTARKGTVAGRNNP